MSIKISGTGCSLGDFVYNGIHFNSPVFQKYLSKKAGDGGLSPGKLVFTEEFEKYAGTHYRDAITEITEGRKPGTFNLGGPGIVAAINASQLLTDHDADVIFYGTVGKDDISEKILSIVKQTPVRVDKYRIFSSNSPFTDVLSDPDFDHGKGERIFVNSIGCAWEFLPEHLDDDFFHSDIVVFGGTALVPVIHDNLSELLQKAKKNG
jgi:sugar/nucleoside kinase (ribokinase family)